MSPATGGVCPQPTAEESAENVTSDARASSRLCSGLVQCDGFKEGFELRQEGGSVSLSWSRLEISPVNTQVLARQGWGESRGTNTHDVCDVHVSHGCADTALHAVRVLLRTQSFRHWAKPSGDYKYKLYTII